MGDPITTTGGSGPGPRVTADAPPPPPPPAAPPVTVTSEHCLDASISDLTGLSRTLAGNPCGAVITGLLPQITDHGNFEIQLAGPLNAGTYRGGVVVNAHTWMEARLFIEDGRIRGTIDFLPPLTKRNGIPGGGDATISQLQINTDPATGAITFGATATYLNLSLPMKIFGVDVSPMNVTEELTETLFGRRMSSIPGPASSFLQAFFQAQGTEGGRLENLVNMAGMRFRVVANRQEGDPLVPELGPVSNAHIRLPELRLSPTVTLSDVDLNVEVHYNEETGGFRVVIPRASIGTIRHAPTVSCNGAPNPGSEIHNVRLEDVTLDMAPTGDRNALGNDMFQATSQALTTLASLCSGGAGDLAALANTQPLYPRSGSGRILMDSGSIQGGDITLHPLTGDRAVTFNLTGQANGDLTATVDAPEVGLDHAALVLGGTLLHNQTSEIGIEGALLRSLHATVDVRSGEVSYNASFTPDLASATLNQKNPEGNLLVSAALMGFTATNPITLSGTAVGTDRESHTLHAEGLRLSPSNARLFNPLGATGTADFGFSGLGLDATFTRSGMRLDRLVLPEYSVGADVSVGGNRIRASIVNGRATDRMLAGLGLILDAADSRGHASGVTHTASVNTRVERLRFTAMGGRTFEMTGTLTGSMGLLDKHTNVPGTFTPPDFRPTVGGMSLRLNGSVREIGGSGVRLSGSRIRISDDARGHVVIAGNTTVNIDGEAITAGARIAADLRHHIHDFSYTRAGGEASAVRYYDFDPDSDLAIPLSQILVEAAVPGVGTLRTIGSGRISGSPRNPNVSANLPFGEQHLTINRPGLPVTGTVDLTGGGLDVRGNRDRLTVAVRPPETVHVDFTQVVDGVTYRYAGDLRSTSSFNATINPRTGRVSFRGGGTAPQLTGDLTVSATAVREGATVTLGSGTAHFETAYSLSGSVDGSAAHLTLSVPSTGLSGSVTSAISLGGNTIPAGTRLNIPIRNFGGTIDLNTRTMGFTSTWTAGDIGPASVTIPSVSLPGGINFTDVTAELTALANGQQWQIDRSAAGAVSFRALPGADGRLPPFEVNLGLRDGSGTGLSLTVGSSSRADGISGSVDPATGETILEVRGMTLASRVGGSATINEQRIDLTGLTADANMPALEVRINSTTGAMRLVATPPTPTGVTHPPTNLNDWMAWTTDQWRDYQTQMNGTSHLAVLSEATMNAPAAGALFPQGRGRIYVDMPRLELTANLRDPASMSALMGRLQESLTMRREFPNPPARSGSGEPIILSDAQRPLYRTTGAPGTLFFISETRSDGPPRLDPDLGRNMEEALGIPRAEVDRILTSGRMEVSDLVTRIRNTPEIRAAISEDDLTTLVTSYLNDSGGSFRRFSNRMIITMGNIRSQLTRLATVGAGGLRGIHAHAFGDPSYHRAPAPNDGTDMQFMAVLPVAPTALARVIETNPSSAWDPWASGGEISGSLETGTLLNDHSFRVTHVETREGNVRVIRVTPTGTSDMVASSRTFRIVPLSGDRSLLVLDQHEDFPGTDVDARLPRMRLPSRPPINLETVGTGALGALRPMAPDLATFYANRFAGMAENLMEMGTGSRTSGVDYDSRSPISRTSRVIEFLALDATDASNPSLSISADATADVIRPMLTARLGVSDAVANRWISAHRVPLSELMTETHLDTHFETATIQALALAVLNPPDTVTDTMRHFSAPTERFLLMMEDLRTAAEIRGTGTGSSFNCRVRAMLDGRFHSRSTAQPDTIDNLMYWFVPGDLGVSAADITWFVHHADQFPGYSSSFAPSRVVPASEIPGAVAGRTYVDTGVVTPSSNFNYRISVPTDPITLPGNILLSPWRQEDRPGARDFLDNQGWWMTLPMRGGGFIVVRAGVINTRLGTDRDPTVSSAALNDVIGFMTAVLNGAQDHAGVASRRSISYGRGTVVSERNASIF